MGAVCSGISTGIAFANSLPAGAFITGVFVEIVTAFNATLTNVLTVGTVAAFLQLVRRFFQPLQDLSDKFNTLQQAMAASERIFKLLDTPEADRGGVMTANVTAEPRHAQASRRARGVTIQFEAVEGSDMEGLPAVGNLRNASAVFIHDGRRWVATGRAVFNLNPDEVLSRFPTQFERAPGTQPPPNEPHEPRP